MAMSCMYQDRLFLLICSVVCMSKISDRCTMVLLNYKKFLGVQFLSGHKCTTVAAPRLVIDHVCTF